MEHQYLKYYFADRHPDKLIPENLNRYRDLIDNYYIYMDEVLGSLVAAADTNTIFMVVSDHGFDEIMMPTGHYNHMEAPPGVFICSGSGIRKNHNIENAHVYDITPTILHLMGMPVAEDMDGRVLTDIQIEDIRVLTIPTYETGRRAARQILESDIDDSYKERLRALGYTN
jgi:predicted AlkP superfamily phosphohydrolase/phosphomutase